MAYHSRTLDFNDPELSFFGELNWALQAAGFDCIPGSVGKVLVVVLIGDALGIARLLVPRLNSCAIFCAMPIILVARCCLLLWVYWFITIGSWRSVLLSRRLVTPSGSCGWWWLQIVFWVLWQAGEWAGTGRGSSSLGTSWYSLAVEAAGSWSNLSATVAEITGRVYGLGLMFRLIPYQQSALLSMKSIHFRDDREEILCAGL